MKNGGVVLKVLWLQAFDFSGNVEAVLGWALGVKQRGIEPHLVLCNVPESLTNAYHHLLKKHQITCQFNITTQQIKNLMYYEKYTLFHTFHPSLFHFTADIGARMKTPWFATLPDLNQTEPGLDMLQKASCICCSDILTYERLKNILFNYPNTRLVQPGVYIHPLEVKESLSKTLRILFIGSRASPGLKALQHAARRLKNCHVEMICFDKPVKIKDQTYSWPPFNEGIFKEFDAVASYGYYLIFGQSLGCIALILNNTYSGPAETSYRHPVSDLQGTDYDDERHISSALINDLKGLLEDPDKRKKLQQKHWSHAKDNHDLFLAGEHLARLYRPHKKE